MLEANPSTFHNLMGLRRLVVGCNKVKLAEQMCATQCYMCGQYGHISGHCKSTEICLDCGKNKSQGECNETRCRSCVHVNQFYPVSNVNHSSLNSTYPTRLLEVSKFKRRINYIMVNLRFEQQNVGKALAAANVLKVDLEDYDVICIQEPYVLSNGKVGSLPKGVATTQRPQLL